MLKLDCCLPAIGFGKINCFYNDEHFKTNYVFAKYQMIRINTIDF